MDQIVIIADDLTGAADTGVQFCPFFDRTVLISYLQLTGEKSRDSAIYAKGTTALYTNSRALTEKSARERLRKIARQLSNVKPPWLYKKMDSCLRGNPGAEAEALMDEMGYEASVIAPAFPEMGRTTVNGTHLVQGVPVGQTEISRDPVTPVTQSDLCKLMQSQCRYPVGHVPMNLLEGRETLLTDEVERQIRKGVRHITFDAACQTHLDRIARLAFESSDRILPVGSAGLAAGFCGFLQSRAQSKTNEHLFSAQGNHLLVCGTNSAVTKGQIKALKQRYPYEEIALDPTVLMDENRRKGLVNSAALVGLKLSATHLIVAIGSSQEAPVSSSTFSKRQAQSMTAGLGRFLATVMAQTGPGLLFMTGGDTADAVLNAVGAGGIHIHGEILPGVVKGSLMGGTMEGLAVVTKAGAFGRDDTLVVLHEKLQGKD